MAAEDAPFLREAHSVAGIATAAAATAPRPSVPEAGLDKDAGPMCWPSFPRVLARLVPGGGPRRPYADLDRRRPDAPAPAAATATAAAAVAEDRLAEYAVHERVGEGAFAHVVRAEHIASGRTVALKVVPRTAVALNELDVLQQLTGAPGVVALLDTFEIPSGQVLVLEYCGGGDVFEAVRHERRLQEDASCPSSAVVVEEATARDRFVQMVHAVRAMHERGICHRDLKLENFLLCQDGVVKLADFGLARQLWSSRGGTSSASRSGGSSQASTLSFASLSTTLSASSGTSWTGPPGEAPVLLHTFCGSLDYGSPEVLLGRPYNGFLSDLWSLGVCLFALTTACFPFDDADAVIHGRLAFPEGMSPDLADLVAGLLVVTPELRLSLDQVLHHPWLAAA